MNSLHTNFCIKKGYVARPCAEYFVDELADSAIVHQPDVYPFAAKLATLFGCKTLIDIGCGRANKLANLKDQFEILGIDFGLNIRHCQDQHSFGRWLEHDLELNTRLPVRDEVLRDSTIIVSDVIEHLVNPSGLLTNLRRFLEQAPLVIVSTPERDLVRGKSDVGPPANIHHIREWNLNELLELLSRSGIYVSNIGLTCNNSINSEKRTTLAVCQPDSARYSRAVPTSFRVLAIMATYNEEDIVVASIDTLMSQGIEVHVIDNWSTDGTIAAIRNRFADKVAVERFPAIGNRNSFDWAGILRRKEEIAALSNANWCIHHDPDEIRFGPWPHLNLREALWQVHSQGFDAIDHTVINFLPVDETFRGSVDMENHFEYFQWGTNQGSQIQIKAWKNIGKVNLSDSGGHEAKFDGRRVYPFNFLIKHYPLRSTRQGKRKLEQLRTRRRADEIAKGWHNHYDRLANAQNLCWRKSQLNFYTQDVFYRTQFCERLTRVGLPFANRPDNYA